MGKENDFVLEVVSVRLVRDAPILSGTEIKTPEDVVRLMGQELCDMDREVVCVINLKVSDGKLMETQTANYFSDIYPIDCAVLSANA